jgi:iron-sulfur cluster assembly protein
MQVDWQDGLNSRGLTFSNPNAASSCGCGTSFSV